MSHSITQPKLNEEEIASIIKRAFGEKALITTLEELKGGFFNTAYRIGIDEDKEYILKVAPSPETKVLRFEENIIETEVLVMELMSSQGIPVPKVHFFDQSREILPCEYFIMEIIEGVSMLELRPKLTEAEHKRIDREIGAYARKINEIKGERFGHIHKHSKQTVSWREAFDKKIRDILKDGIELNVALQVDYNDLYDLLKSNYSSLDLVIEPRFIHYDLWDGNVIINERMEIAGIIDWERAFWGDPLIEFNFNYLAYKEAFNEGYGLEMLGTSEEKSRRLLYDIYYFLINAIEVTNRQYENKDQEKWACDHLKECLAKLRQDNNHLDVTG